MQNERVDPFIFVLTWMSPEKEKKKKKKKRKEKGETKITHKTSYITSYISTFYKSDSVCCTQLITTVY